MSNTTQEKLYETFVAISGGGSSNPDPMIDATEELAGTATRLAKVMESVAASDAPASAPAAPATIFGALAPLPEAAVPALKPVAATTSTTQVNTTVESVTSALLQNVFGAVPLAGAIQNAQSGNSGGGGITAGLVASTVLKSGLGLVPLIGGLLGLFGGGDSPEPEPLVKYAMPPSVAFRGASTDAGVAFSDYDQMGMPRGYGAPAPAASAPVAPPQITVNVQAMDARSFLDRSGDIAAAVREAMLNLNSLNDVVSEL